MSDKITIGRIEFGNPAKAAAVKARIVRIKAENVPVDTEHDFRRREIAYLKALMIRHREAARRFAQELALT